MMKSSRVQIIRLMRAVDPTLRMSTSDMAHALVGRGHVVTERDVEQALAQAREEAQGAGET